LQSECEVHRERPAQGIPAVVEAGRRHLRLCIQGLQMGKSGVGWAEAAPRGWVKACPPRRGGWRLTACPPPNHAPRPGMRIPATSSPSTWPHPRHGVYFSFALWLEIHFDSLFCNCGGLPAPFGGLRRGGLPPPLAKLRLSCVIAMLLWRGAAVDDLGGVGSRLGQPLWQPQIREYTRICGFCCNSNRKRIGLAARTWSCIS